MRINMRNLSLRLFKVLYILLARHRHLEVRFDVDVRIFFTSINLLAILNTYATRAMLLNFVLVFVLLSKDINHIFREHFFKQSIIQIALMA